MTEGEQHAMSDTCFEYDDHLRANVHFTGGEALQPAETALTLYWKNGKVATTDGPYAETKEQVGGILVLEARDLNHAVQLMAQHPALKYGRSGIVGASLRFFVKSRDILYKLSRDILYSFALRIRRDRVPALGCGTG